jgi:lysophospholipase L1-like esterase
MYLKRTVAVTLAAAIALSSSAALSQRAAPGVTYSTDAGIAPQKRPDPQRFDKRVAAYLDADAKTPPAKCGILFIGSATIAGWKSLEADMAPAPVLGRGLGGSTVADEIFYFDKIVTPYRPRAIFIYVGENDVVNGLNPGEVLADFKSFMALKRKTLGATQVYFLSAKAAPARLTFARNEQAANDLIQTFARTQPDIHYIDISHPMWEDGRLFGTLRPIYRQDGIHLTEEGYGIITRIIKPYVTKEAARTPNCAGS